MPKRQSNQRWKAEVQRIRREAAEKRQVIRDARTDAEQLAILDMRPGESLKEKTRLRAMAFEDIAKESKKEKKST